MTAPHLLADLWQRLWREIARYPLPKRRHRTNPRVVKRKMSNSGLNVLSTLPGRNLPYPFARPSSLFEWS
jgi:hypothetical protein